MIQNIAGQSVYFEARSLKDGTLVSGLSVSASLSLDGTAPVSSTNTVSEIGTTGRYQLLLSQSETDHYTLAVLLTTATADVFLPLIQADFTPVPVIPTVSQIQTGLAKTSELPDVSGLATAADIPTVSQIQSGLAKTSEVNTVASDVWNQYVNVSGGVGVDTEPGFTHLMHVRSFFKNFSELELVSTYSQTKYYTPKTLSTAASVATLQTSVDAIPTATYNVPTAAQIAESVCDEALSGHTTAGTLGKVIQDTATATTASAISSAVSEIQTSVGVMNATVENLQTTMFTINSNVQAISGYTDELEDMVQDLPTSSGIADTVWGRAANTTSRTLTTEIPVDLTRRLDVIQGSLVDWTVDGNTLTTSKKTEGQTETVGVYTLSRDGAGNIIQVKEAS